MDPLPHGRGAVRPLIARDATGHMESMSKIISGKGQEPVFVNQFGRESPCPIRSRELRRWHDYLRCCVLRRLPEITLSRTHPDAACWTTLTSQRREPLN